MSHSTTPPASREPIQDAAVPRRRALHARTALSPTFAMGWRGGLVWLIAAAGAGVVVPFLPPLIASLITAALVAAGLAFLGRRHFRRPLRSLPFQPSDEVALSDVDPGSAVRFRMPRALYYLGLLFIGQLAIRPASGLTVSDLFFFAAFVATCLELVSSRQSTIPGIRPRPLLLGTLLFAVGAVISSVSLEAPGQSLAYCLRFVYVTLFWFWMGSVVLRTSRHVAWAVSMWVTSVALSGGAAMAQLSLGDVIPGTSPVFGRMTGTAVHINDLGGMAGIALPVAVALMAGRAGKVRRRWATGVVVLFVGAGVVLSGSVGGLLAATVGVATFAIASRIRRRTMVTALVMFAGSVLIISAQQDAGAPSPFERASQVTGPEDDPTSTLGSRVDTHGAALDAIAQSPIVGYGLGQPVPKTGFTVHNIVLGPWYEGGLFAMVGMVVILTGLVSAGMKAVGAARSRQEWQLAIGLFAAFCSFLVFATGAPVLFQRYAWAPAAMLIALRCQQNRRPVALSSYIPQTDATSAGSAA